MRRVFTTAGAPLSGTIRVPGDKSLSHRGVLFASMAEGHSIVTGVLDSADVRSTITACEALGAGIEFLSEGESGLSLRITGWGASGPRQPEHPIDCGNSGTTARLLLGVLSGAPVSVRLTGDSSLSRRPMLRVTGPLSEMGAGFEFEEDHTLPVTVRGSGVLRPIVHASPVASAQVKTAILLAGLKAFGMTRVTEPSRSRDHTERLLPAFGVPVAVDDAPGAAVNGPVVPHGHDLGVPGDPSSAAFMVTAALLVPGSEVVVEGVSLNPTRTGFIRVLERMGGRVSSIATGSEGAEPVGRMLASYSSDMRSTVVAAHEIPTLVDEVPILALAAAVAEGTTRFEGVSELRVKESDRLSAISEGLATMGVSTRAGEDWLEIDGAGALQGAVLDSLGDHRLAMTWSVAGLVAAGQTVVDGFEAVGVSYPRFASDLQRLSRG